MTESQLRMSPINWLAQYLGIKEGSAQHLAILKVFNDSGLCSRYKMTPNDAWCAMASSAAFIAAGLAGKPGSGKLFECVECSCGYMIDLAKKQGIWQEADNYVPKVGDLLLYDWQDSGAGDNTGWPDHVGIVAYVEGNTFKVLEGNASDTVKYVAMTVNARYIRGFITPNYAKFATTNESAATVTKPTTSTTTSTSSSSSAPNKTCKFKGTVTASALNVREWAGTNYKVLRCIAKGTVVEVCDTVFASNGDDWYYIKESGKYGFVNADYINKADAATTSNSITFKGTVTTGLNMRSGAGTEHGIVRVLGKGTKVEVLKEVKASTGKAWYYVKELTYNKLGYVSAAYIARD